MPGASTPLGPGGSLRGMSPTARVLLISTSAIIGLDQVSKALVRANLRPPPAIDEVVIIPNYLSIAHAINKGAAFSAMADYEHRLLVFFAFTAVAVAMVGIAYRKLAPEDRLLSAALGILLGGALGNFIDRVWAGEVTDMIKVYAGSEPARSWCIAHFGTSVWPIFNVADMAIWIGVVGFLLAYLMVKDRPVATPSSPLPSESQPTLD